MKKVFVTGGDGLLGIHVVEELLARGMEVTVLVQPGRRNGMLDGLSLQQAEGDLLDPALITRLVAGHDAVIHLAAFTAVFPSKGDIFWKVNVTGTDHIIEACLQNKVRRLVVCSSASVYEFGSKAQPGVEGRLRQRGTLDYIDSKQEAQLHVERAVKERGLPAIIVNPTFMIGAKDSKPSSGEFMVNVCKGNVPGYTQGGKNWVFVRDAATAVVNGLTQGRIGESYILGHENLSFQEIIGIIGEVTGKKMPRLSVPSFAILAIGRASSLFYQLTGRKVKLSYEMAKISTEGHYFSPQKAVTELGLPQTPIREAFAEAHEWFSQHGYY